jgi:CRP/FNR family cyclic AMP-dependent transcriptional regulator
MTSEKAKNQRTFFLNLLGGNEPAKVQAGQTIVEIGQPGGEAYMIKSGTARIDMFEGEHVVDLEPGDWIGLMGSIDGRPYSNRIVAVTDCELIPIDRKRAEYLFREHPSFAFKIIQTMIDRFYVVQELAKQGFGK